MDQLILDPIHLLVHRNHLQLLFAVESDLNFDFSLESLDSLESILLVGGLIVMTALVQIPREGVDVREENVQHLLYHFDDVQES